ncbi:exonuclease domain-containing protein [Clostridium sardiniense]|uniref:exonuclease domain-containing protein n=1 Tax=Clostridium sardiniense TaxID=29369 RepID=UPI003D350D69
MNNNIEAYYYIEGETNNFILQYIIKDPSNNKVLIKIKKRLKEESYKIAYYHGLHYICKNILSLISLNEIEADRNIIFFTDKKDVVNKINKKSFSYNEEYEYIQFFLDKFYNYKCIEIKNVRKIISKEKRPPMALYIRCKKAGKEYRKLIKRNSTLLKLNKYLIKAKELIFFDFEMNCLVNFNDVEIISIGAVKTTLDGEIISKFYRCIKPKKIYKLTDKCIEITSLKQEEIDKAKSFESVFKEFELWCGNNDKLFLYWGGNDIAVLKNDNNRTKENIEIVNYILNYNIDYQEVLCKDILKLDDSLSLKNAVLKYGILFEGSQHNALDDSYNLSKLYFEERKSR